MSSPRLQIGRHSQPGAYYLITTVLHRRSRLFVDAALAQIVMDGFFESEARNIAWVVMPDHIHWLMQLQDAPLSRCMRAFKSRSARAINATRGAAGPVWQAGYYDRRIRNDDELRATARYIVANPLRGGLVERIEDYPYWWCPWISSMGDLLE